MVQVKKHNKNIKCPVKLYQLVFLFFQIYQNHHKVKYQCVQHIKVALAKFSLEQHPRKYQ